jgi:hypothetical protein
MILISHRGNTEGPILEKENSPDYIDNAIKNNLIVEVDISYLKNKFFLGHDHTDYLINEKWILQRKNNILFHCKNLKSCVNLHKLDKNIFMFCHSSDPYVIMSNGGIWVHDINLELNEDCYIPLISQKDIDAYNKRTVAGICTDYVYYARDILESTLS